MVTREEQWEQGRDSDGVWDLHVHAAIFKVDEQQEPTA